MMKGSFSILDTMDRFVRRFFGLLWISFGLGSCGMGTDVGNGLKPKEQEEERVNRRTEGQPDSSTTPASDQDTGYEENSNETQNTGASGQEGYIPLLLAECVSPLVQAEGEFKAKETQDSFKISSPSKVGQKTLVVGETSYEILLTPQKDQPFAVDILQHESLIQCPNELEQNDKIYSITFQSDQKMSWKLDDSGRMIWLWLQNDQGDKWTFLPTSH